MTWAQVLATGSGKTGFRLVIEGLSREFVTDSSMERTTTDGRLRREGLKRESIELSSGSGIIDGKLKAEGFTARVADINGEATAAFATAATQTTFATADITPTSNTVNVSSTTGWAASGSFHIGTERCTYTGTTATSFTGLTRGTWDTIAQSHFSAFSSTMSRRTEITNQCVTIEGRRAYLYAYGEGDDPQGNGTSVFRGIVSRDANLENPAEWSITIDGMQRVLEQELVGPANGTVEPRGVYYSWAAPLYIQLQQSTTNAPVGALDAARKAILAFTGFFETQDAFCNALNAALATAMTGWETSLRAVSQGPDGWYPTIRVGATARWLNVTISSPIDYSFSTYDLQFAMQTASATAGVMGNEQALIATVAANTTYILRPLPRDSRYAALINGDATLGQVPRGSLLPGYAFTAYADPTVSASLPSLRVYLGGDSSSAFTATALFMDTGDGDRVYSFALDTSAASLAGGYVGISSVSSFPPLYWSGPGVRLTFSRQIQTTFGNGVAGLIEWLINNSAQFCNLGGTPLLTSADFDASWKLQIEECQRGKTVATQRFYFAPRKSKFLEYLAEECKLIGAFPALNANGQIKFVPVELKAETQTAAATINASTTLTGQQWPGYERSAMGTLNEVVLRTKYNVMEDKHLGVSYNVRDVTAYSRSKMPRTLEIAPKSTDGFAGNYDPFDDVVDLSANVLGIFGRPYVTVDVAVPWTLYSVTPGDTVVLTNVQLPNILGTRGVTNAQGLVLGKRFNANDAHGILTLLIHGQNIAGYTPTARVSSQTLVSGNTWDITIATAGMPAGYVSGVSSFAVNDLVRVYSYNANPTVEVAGTINSFVGNVARVTFTSTWTPGTAGWNFGFSDAATITSTQRQTAWTFIARSTNLITWQTGTTQARTFAP